MKKIILILSLFMFISPLYAETTCDENEEKQYKEYALNITKDNDYSIGSKRFTITLYNVISDVYVMYDGKKYVSDSNDTVVINDIKEGTNVIISIYATKGCTKSLRTIYVDEPYYNTFLDSSVCEGYEDKISYCTAKFTSTPVTKELIQIAIENYKHSIVQSNDEKQEIIEDNTFEKVMDFLTNWGIKGLLFIATSLLTINAFHNKFVKIKHGI